MPATVGAFVPPAMQHGTASWASGVAPSAVSPALIRVTTDVDIHPGTGVPARILVDGIPRDEWGLSWLKIDAGTHVIAFTDAPSFTTPTPITVTTVSGQTTEAHGVFAARGSLRVVTDPALPSTISIDGVPRDDWGVWFAAPPGTYTVSFGAVVGYAPPADQTVTVTADQLTTVTGHFTADASAKGPDPTTFGLLRVTTQRDDRTPGVGTQILVDGIPRDEWGLSWVKVPPGSHTIGFTDIPGLGTPAPESVNVVAGETTTATGIFARYGSLRVRTDPALAGTISLDGIVRDDWAMWMSVPAGNYNVTFEAVPGMTIPTGQFATVEPGALTVVTGEYGAATASLNWAGYVVASDFTSPLGVVTDVRGSWIVPAIQATSKAEYSSVWIGIGGLFQGDTSLIQTGTEADSGSGATFYAAWYELLPNFSIRITNQMTSCPILPTTNDCLVKPGDTISGDVALKDASSNLWTITLADVSQGWTFVKDFTYMSSERSAEWIVERPALCTGGGCKLAVLASFASVALGLDTTGILGTNSATIGTYPGTIGAFPRRVVQMFSGTTLLAQPSDLSSDGTSFVVTKLA